MRRRASVPEPDEFPSFRFSQEDGHIYTCMTTGEEIVHITQLLELDGLSDPRWYTEACRVRGSAVHALTTSFDLGALDVETCVSPYRSYLLGHVKVMSMLRPEWLHIETPFMHARPKFCGRPDRVAKLFGAWSVLEIKSGDPEPSHGPQLALQSMLVAPILGLPARSIQRYAEYLRPNGKGRIEQFPNPADFDRADNILARFCS